MAQPDAYPEEFAQWLLVALPDASSDLVQKRWAGVAAAASRIEDSVQDTLDVVRLLYAIPPRAPLAAQAFRNSFVQHDPQFANSSNALEVELLAGATIASVVRADGEAAGVAALAVLAADACGARRNERNQPFVELARQRRKAIAAKGDADESWPQLEDEIVGDLGPDDGDRIARFAAEMSAFGSGFFARLREESDIAWWVLGQYSRDFDKPIRELPPTLLPILLAKELRDLTRSEIGPVSAKAVLWRMLSLHEQPPVSTTFADAVADLPADWLVRWLDGIGPPQNVDGLMPVLYAAWSRKKGIDSDWRSAFLRGASLSADPACATLDLANQVYSESLLASAIAKSLKEGEE